MGQLTTTHRNDNTQKRTGDESSARKRVSVACFWVLFLRAKIQGSTDADLKEATLKMKENTKKRRSSCNETLPWPE